MAVTGLAWAGFVLTHMLGNLLIFAGPQAYNRYGHTLTSNPLLIIAEAGLVGTLLLHIYQGVVLTLRNRGARKQKYAMPTNGEKAARFQSKWMAFHGTLLLVFIVLHIVQFKFGPGQTEGYEMMIDGQRMRDLHRLVIETFRQPIFLAWYAVCLVGVGLHLSHGFASSFSSLGLHHPKYSPLISKVGYVYAAIVALGFISPPLYVFFAAPH